MATSSARARAWQEAQSNARGHTLYVSMQCVQFDSVGRGDGGSDGGVPGRGCVVTVTSDRRRKAWAAVVFIVCLVVFHQVALRVLKVSLIHQVIRLHLD